MTLPLQLLYQSGDLNLVTAYTTHQYLEELHQHLRTTFTLAQQQLQRSSEGRKAYYNQKASHHELNVGDKSMALLLRPTKAERSPLPV